MSTANKLTYLNTTKGKIKDSINLTGANIGTNDTFRSYEKKLKDGLVDIINNGTDTVYNNFPKVTGTGSSVTLNSTYQAPMKVELKSNTYQGSDPTSSSPKDIEVVTGYNNITIEDENGTNSQSYEINFGADNLLNNTATTSTINGITFTVNDDKTITVNTGSGTSTAQTDFTIGYVDFKANTTYLLTGAPAGSGSNHYLSIRGYGNDTGDGRDYTPTEDITKEIFLRIKSGISVNNVVIKPMVVKGTYKYDYVPYGVKPIEMCKIPNTEYEDEIRCSTGKNLFDKENIETGKYYTSNTISTSQNWVITQIPVKTNTNYYLSGNNYNNTTARIVLLNGSKNVISDVGGYKDVKLITTNSNTAYIGLSIANYSDGSDLNSIQLEQNNQATDYEPYGIGVWYKYGKIGKVVLNGSEQGWSYNSDNVFFGLNGYINDYLYSDGNITYCCDKYKPIAQTSQDTAFKSAAANYNFNFRSTSSRLRIKNTNYSDANTFKTDLGTNPITLYYVLATPTATILDTELQNQLNNLKGANSYSGQTNITAEYITGNQPFIMNLVALKDE